MISKFKAGIAPACDHIPVPLTGSFIALIPLSVFGTLVLSTGILWQIPDVICEESNWEIRR